MNDEMELEQMIQQWMDKLQPYYTAFCSFLATALVPFQVVLPPILTRIHRLLCHVLLVRLSACGPWNGAIPLIYITLLLLFVADPLLVSSGAILISLLIFVTELICGTISTEKSEDEFLFGEEEPEGEEVVEERETVRFASLEMMPSSSHAPYIIKCSWANPGQPVGGFHKHLIYNFEKFFINCHNMKRLTVPISKLIDEDFEKDAVKCRELCLLFPFDHAWGNEHTASIIKACQPEILNLKTAQGKVTREQAPPLTVLRQVPRLMFSTVDVDLLLCLDNINVVSVNIEGATGKQVVRIIEQWRGHERRIEWMRVVLSDVREIRKAYFRHRVSEKEAKVSRGDLELSVLIEKDHVVLSTLPFCP